MKRLILSLCCTIAILMVQGQSISELRSKKSDAEKQIRFTNALLEEARRSEETSLTKLKLLKSQISYRDALIRNMNEEIQIVDDCIANNNEVVDMLRSDLEKLKKEYASMIRFAQKNKNNYDVLIFLLSADNMNQAYKRWLYLRQYAKYRQNQGEIIRLVSAQLDKNIERLTTQKQIKTNLLADKMEESNLLEKAREEQNRFLVSLQQKQKDLRKKIREQQKIQDELNRKIQLMLEEEAKKAAGTAGYALTPEQKLVSADFEKNKGRIPWPVARGVITEHFGIHNHPVLKQIQVRNNGIDISTDNGAKARAVFEGEVSRVFAISGGNMAVIIRHGSFLSVYSNLREVWVKQGQKVALKQEIGSVFTDQADGNTTILKFQVWKENQKLDPEEWISR